MKFRSLAFSALCLSLFGCSGGGLTGSGPSLNISSSKSAVAYGEAVTVSWNSSGLEFIDDSGSSFQLGAHQFNGSVTDRPAVSSTYSIRGVQSNGQAIVQSKTVTVAKSDKKILLLGDAAQPGVTQLAQSMNLITTQPVTINLSAAQLTNYDAVVIHESANIGTADQSAVASFLSSGRGVVLLAKAAPKLATGSPETGSVAAIGSWFAGAQELVFFLGVERVVQTSPVIPLGAVILNDEIAAAHGVRPVSSNAVLLTTGINDGYAAFAYSPTIGGRVGYVGAIGVGSSSGDLTITALILAETRWA